MDTTRILIIEDDITLSEQVAQLLQKEGFATEQCHDGEQGLLTALQHRFDLILLDVLLPSLNGLSLLNQLRKVKQTPVMMITASGAEQERIEGYQNGADDYLPKPFSFTELKLRIEAVLRRTLGGQKHSTPVTEITVDELRLVRSQQAVIYAGRSLEFTPIQFRLLWVMLENKEQILSKAMLYQTVLDRAYSRYDRSLDMHMSRIRKKLTDSGMVPQRLATVHGKGYRFS